MRTWYLWTLGYLSLSAVLKLIVVGFHEAYPRLTSRGSDALDVFILLAWVVWGLLMLD